MRAGNPKPIELDETENLLLDCPGTTAKTGSVHAHLDVGASCGIVDMRMDRLVWVD